MLFPQIILLILWNEVYFINKLHVTQRLTCLAWQKCYIKLSQIL